MGSLSDQMIDNENEKFERKLAITLGLSYEELQQLDYEIDTDESDDGLIYQYIIKIKDSSPADIVRKIIGLENNQVWLSIEDI